MGESLKFLLELEDKFSSPANKAISSVAKLTETLGGIGKVLGPLIKVEAAMFGLGAAAIIGGAALAIHASEAKEDTLNTLDAMMGSHEAALETYSAISDIGGKIDLSLEKGSELAKQLSAAGLTNKEDLVNAVKSIAEVTSVLGEGAGGKIQKLLEKSSQTGQFKVTGKALTGTGVDEGLLAQKLGVTKKQLEAGKVNAARGIAAITSLLDEKFAAVAEKKALNLGAQFTRLKDNISKLFEDVDAGPFLTALGSVVHLFDKSTETGKAFKFLITSVFDGLFKVAAKAIPYVTTLLKGMAIIGLKVYIAMKPLAKTFFDMGDSQGSLDRLASTMSTLGDVIAFVTKATALMIEPWVDLAEVIWDGNVAVIGAIGGAVSFLADIVPKFLDAGANLIGGLVDGIKNGASKVVDAVKNMAHDALDKFTGIFGIHSDSKLMAKMGGHLMGGLESGIAANDNGPQSAMGKAMGGLGSPASLPGPTSSAGGSTSVTIGPGAIVISINGSNAGEISSQLKEVLPGELAAMFETLGLSVGAA